MTADDVLRMFHEQDATIERLQRRIEALEMFQRSLTLVIGVKKHERTKQTTRTKTRSKG